MASNFSIDSPAIQTRGEAPTFGSFWVHAIVDLDKHYRQERNTSAASDDFQVIKTRNKWIIRDSYYRVTGACDATVTLNFGTSEAGTEIAAAVDGTATSNWTQGTIDPQGNQEFLTADGWIWLMIDTAATDQGKVEFMIEFVAGPDDNQI